MHQLAPNALSHFYVPPHFIYLLFLFFLLFFMYQLTQIPFQNFSVFYVPTVPHPLLTFIPARPARIRTTTQTHNTNPHTHHDTPANTFPRPPPPCRTPNRTTAPYSQPYHRTVPRPPSTTVQPYHHAFPRPYRYTIANTTCHTPRRTTIPHNHAVPLHRTIAPHSQTYDLLTTQLHDPDTRRPVRRRPDAAPDATSARVAAGPPTTLTPTLARRVDVIAPSRRRPDTVTPFTVPACWQGCSPA